MPFRNSYVILSKQFFYLFHAYARKNNMWILDQPLSPQLPDLLLDLMFMRHIPLSNMQFDLDIE